ETVEYAAYETLLQQAVPSRSIGVATGTMDTLFFTMMLIGTAISGFLAASLGLTVSIAGLGLLILLATVASWARLRSQTVGQPDPATLARIPAFAAVPAAVREWAVRRMAREQMAAGPVIIRQGAE